MRAYTHTVVLAILSIFPQQTRPRVAATPNTSEDVKALVSRQYTAIQESNSEALQTLYGNGPQLIFFPPGGGRQAGVAAHLQALDEFRKANGLRWQMPRDLSVLPLATNAVLTTASFGAEGTAASGQRVMFDGRHTAVWQRSGAQWRIVHEHMSGPWTPPPPSSTIAAGNAPQIVAEVLNAYQDAWSSGDAAGLANLWDEDGDIGTLGAAVSTRGRQAITDFWTQTISRRRTPTVVQAAATNARGVASDAIAADGAFEYRARSASANAPAASIDRFSLILRHVDNRWRIATLRIAAGR